MKNKKNVENKKVLKGKRNLELLFKPQGCCKIYVDGNLVGSEMKRNENECASYARDFGATYNFIPNSDCT